MEKGDAGENWRKVSTQQMTFGKCFGFIAGKLGQEVDISFICKWKWTFYGIYLQELLLKPQVLRKKFIEISVIIFNGNYIDYNRNL